jgi:hypothetical protein
MKILKLTLAAAALTLALNASAQAFTSPAQVTQWDVVISGADVGVAHMSFAQDGTFSVVAIHTPKALLSSGHSLDESRGTGGDDSRQGLPAPPTLPDHTNLHGMFVTPVPDVTLPSGAVSHEGSPTPRWGFDASGKLIGFFTEISAPITITTNAVNGVTNVDYLRLTNSISFVGKVSLNNGNLMNSRLTLVCTTPGGKATYQGLPSIALTNLSGPWSGTKHQATLDYNEFFTMNSLDALSYAVAGEGPGYAYPDGTAMIVRQKKMGFALPIIHPQDPAETVPSNNLQIRSVIGSVNLKNGSFSGRGVEDTDTGIEIISFKARMSPVGSPN